MKRIITIIIFYITIITLGDVFVMITKSGAIANWGSIIIPSIILGLVWESLLGKSNLLNYLLPVSLAIIKIILSYLFVSNLLIISAIMMLFVYSLASGISIIIGKGLVRRKKEDSDSALDFDEQENLNSW
jgi:hypothetical protein